MHTNFNGKECQITQVTLPLEQCITCLCALSSNENKTFNHLLSEENANQ